MHTSRDGDLRGWTQADVLPADGMQEVRGCRPFRSRLPPGHDLAVLPVTYSYSHWSAAWAESSRAVQTLPCVAWLWPFAFRQFRRSLTRGPIEFLWLRIAEGSHTGSTPLRAEETGS